MNQPTTHMDPFGLITFDCLKPVKKLFFPTSFAKAHGALTEIYFFETVSSGKNQTVFIVCPKILCNFAKQRKKKKISVFQTTNVEPESIVFRN